MTYQQIFSQSDLEDHLKTSLNAAKERAKYAILNASGQTLQKEELLESICDESRITPFSFLEQEMTTGVAKVTQEQRIQIEFLVPFQGDECVILKHCNHTVYENPPKALYIPGSTDENTGEVKKRNCILFFVISNQQSDGKAFVNEAKIFLSRLQQVLQPNMDEVQKYNDNQLPHCVNDAIDLATIAAKRLQEADAYLETQQN
jgi:hypothetical protein